MTAGAAWASARRRAEPILAELAARLGVDHIETNTLTVASGVVIGVDRTTRCLEVIGESWLSQRASQLGYWAALVAAFTQPTPDNLDAGFGRDSRPLPQGWWTRQLHDNEGAPAAVTPDDVLFGSGKGPRYRTGGEWGTALSALAARAATEGVSVTVHDHVDLHWPGPHRVDPVHAERTPLKLGDRVTLSYDDGGLIEGSVVEVDENGPRVEVDYATTRHTFPATLGWAVAVTWRDRAVHLPAEEPGTDTDPYGRQIRATPEVLGFLETVSGRSADEIWARLLAAVRAETLTAADVHAAAAEYDALAHFQPGFAHVADRGLRAMLDD
jgi:hypothetical protein